MVTNTSAGNIEGPLRITITEFKNKRHYLGSADGTNDEGQAYFDIEIAGGVLTPGETTEAQPVRFKKMSGKAWKKWKSALRKVYLTSNRTHQRLQQPLGRWLQPYSSESHWIWWRHEAGKTLYERRTESEWYKWEEVPRNY